MLDNKILAMWSLFCAVRNSNLTGWSSWKIRRRVGILLCYVTTKQNTPGKQHEEQNVITSTRTECTERKRHKTQQSALTTKTFIHFWNKHYAWRLPMQLETWLHNVH